MQAYIPLILLELLILAGGIAIVRRLFLATLIYKSKCHLESAFDSIEDPLAIIKRNYEIIRVNKAYADFVGKKFSQILNKKCHVVLRNRESPCEDCKIKEVFHTERKFYIPTSQHPRLPDTRNISFTFYPFRPKKKAEASVVEHIRDITELEYLKNNLEKRNKSLSDTTVILRQAQSEINDELELARQVQRSSLPQKPPSFEGLKIVGTYHPIKAVGGDMYDYIQFSPDRLAIFIGDASGHGLPAAFISTMSKMLLYNHTREETQPAEILDRINRDLLGSIRTTYYLTAVCAVFDQTDNSIVYARAGHPKPIVIRPDGQVIHLGAYGTFIGILDDAVYEQRKFFLHKGDRIYFCTDGIFEVVTSTQDHSGSILGFKQFSDIIVSVNHLPLDEVIPALQEKLSGYVYEDDYTLLIAEVTADIPPVNIGESLPGFDTGGEIGYFTFSKNRQTGKQFEAVAIWMQKKNYSKDEIQRMQICMSELISNALEHGNRNDPHKLVTMAYSVTDDEVRLCVVDEGGGFDLASVPDPTHDANLNREGGRGLYLVSQFVDSISQNSSGNGICITRKKRQVP
jgi:serine phosphatase RsbU (regulator of sigma subunit)/anti-sigma regulatory factor (Ser/Thr protein kinase)